MIRSEVFVDAPVLTAERLTADRDAWLRNEPVESYAIPIGRVVLDSDTQALVSRFTREPDMIAGSGVLDPLEEQRALRKTGLNREEYRQIIAEPYAAVRGLISQYIQRCDPRAALDYPDNVAFGMWDGQTGYHTDRYEGKTPDQPVHLRFATYWGEAGPTRFGIGPLRRDQLEYGALLIGTPEENGLQVVTYDEGVVACFAGAHGMHSGTDLAGTRLFITNSAIVPATR